MKKSLSIILSIVLVITSTFCLGFSAFADNSINYDGSSKTLTLTGFKVLTSEDIESFENKSDVVRINLKSDIEEVGASVFDDFASLQKLVVYNPDCQFNTVGALPKGSSATIYSYPSSKVQEHAENHEFNFKKIYKLSFVQKDSTENQKVITVVDALEDDTPQDIAKMAPEFTNKEILHYKDSKGKEKHVCQVWDPAIVTPTSDAVYTEKTRSFYCEDYKGTRVTKVATCQNEGEGEIYCTVCKYVFDKYTIDKADHDFGENNELEFCIVCDERNPDYVPPVTTEPSTEPVTEPVTSPVTVPSTVTTTTPATSATTTTTAPATTTTLPTTTPSTAQATTKAPAVSKPKSTKIKKLTKGKKSITATWSKVSGVKGYQIQIATDKKFKKDKKTVTIKKQKTTKTTIKKLKANKKYYVRIRTYKVVNKKNVYSSWSSVKSIKTK